MQKGAVRSTSSTRQRLSCGLDPQSFLSIMSSQPPARHRYVLIYPRGIAGPPPASSVELGYDDRVPPVYELTKAKGKELDDLEADYEDPQLAFSELGEHTLLPADSEPMTLIWTPCLRGNAPRKASRQTRRPLRRLLGRNTSFIDGKGVDEVCG